MAVSATHPSLQRLLQCAIAATAGEAKASRVVDEATLRDRLGLSAQQWHNWKERGVSMQAAVAAEREFGCAAVWILEGRLQAHENAPGWMPTQRSIAGSESGISSVAHAVSQVSDSDPPLVQWEALMAEELPPTFRVRLEDSALAPELRAGDELVIDTSLQPTAGDIVLIRAAAGHHMARVYRVKTPGRWVAHAPNPDFEPLDADAHRLTVIGVATSEIRKRRRSQES